MTRPKHPAAFINNIAEEGTKEEAITFLQRTWDDLIEAQTENRRLRAKVHDLENRMNPRSYEDGTA